jgi:hypothetical protein
MIHELTRLHPSRHGTPVIARVDAAVFVRRYFTHCMMCAFCNDSCCAHGVDVDVVTVSRILAHANDIERATGTTRDAWFEPNFREDSEHPGGRFTRTRVADGRCVFRRPNVRGCALHAWALDAGVDYHDVKPMVSALFPLTFDDGLLHASDEIEDGTLVCAGEGPTLYRGVRGELAHYFGDALTTELDALESRALLR